jgi:hypothetical protein
MLTAFAPWGASGAADEPESAGIGIGIGVVMGTGPDVAAPTIPGVVRVSGPKLTEAGPAAGVLDDEQPAMSSRAIAVAAAAGAAAGMR